MVFDISLLTAQFPGVVKYSDSISTEGKSFLAYILDITLNHLMAMLQSWNFREYRILIHYY